MELPSAYVTGLREVTRGVSSARPGAPVVPHVEPVPAGRWRRVSIVAILRRLRRARVAMRIR